MSSVFSELSTLDNLNINATGLSIEEIRQKLDSIPVFTIADEQGAPLVANDNGEKVSGVFISQEDAENFVIKLKNNNSALAEQVKVVPVSLGEVYQLAESSENQEKDFNFTYVPQEDAVDSAKTILADQGLEYQGGVPLFVAKEGDNKGYLTIEQDSKQVIPFFFEQQQLEELLTKLGEQKPDLAANVIIEVVPLEGVIETLETSDDEILEKIVLVPSSESLNFLNDITNVSDFNDDGNGDLIWRNKITGKNSIWLMDGTTKTKSFIIDPVTDTNWDLVATGDLNNDGDRDLIWRNEITGKNAAWLMDGTAKIEGIALASVTNTDWEIKGTSDFNDDGNTDLVWRNKTTGQNAVWLMDGTTQTESDIIEPVTNTDWDIKGMSDFNDDGNTDLVWRNKTTGQNAIWLMDGTTKTESVTLDSVSNSDWDIVGVSDLDGDRNGDLVWRNQITGQTSIWFMDGTTITAQESLLEVPNSDWTLTV